MNIKLNIRTKNKLLWKTIKLTAKKIKPQKAVDA
jgi:hypothetical protein